VPIFCGNKHHDNSDRLKKHPIYTLSGFNVTVIWFERVFLGFINACQDTLESYIHEVPGYNSLCSYTLGIGGKLIDFESANHY
jgi:hypothetical protein